MKKNVILPAIRITSETKSRMDRALKELNQKTMASFILSEFREMSYWKLSTTILSGDLVDLEKLFIKNW